MQDLGSFPVSRPRVHAPAPRQSLRPGNARKKSRYYPHVLLLGSQNSGTQARRFLLGDPTLAWPIGNAERDSRAIQEARNSSKLVSC